MSRLRLTTFGGLALTQDGRPYTGPAAQPRRLALLAIIAAAGVHGISRDRLLALLWSDAGGDQARRALNQALHQIRVALGAEVFGGAGSALVVGATHVTSDVGEFEVAVAERASERIATIHHGAFLDGFRLDDAPEFTRWVAATRARLARTWTDAVESLAAGATARGDHAAAARWLQQLVVADPANTRAVVALVDALGAAGDHPAARRAATAHPNPDSELSRRIQRLSGGGRDRQGRAQERIDRATEGRYSIDGVASKGAVITTYHAIRGAAPVEIHVINARAMAHADPERWVRVLSRVGQIADRRIVPVLDVGGTDDCLYYVTPPAAGESLRERLSRERELTIVEAMRLAREVAAALAVAHEHGVTHGDLRPKYIALTPTGLAISGWAMIDALTPALDAGGGAAETAVTIAAPAYASPEQFQGSVSPDRRIDVYSLGCVMFEMLAGMPPFGPTGGQTLITRKLTETAPSVRLSRDQVSDAMDRVIARCLARVAADRYQHGAEVAEALAVIPV